MPPPFGSRLASLGGDNPPRIFHTENLSLNLKHHILPAISKVKLAHSRERMSPRSAIIAHQAIAGDG
jgi:hypothetical protein